MLDTHAIARSLTAADFTPAQADALTDALREVREEGDHVTSDQFKAGQAEVQTEIAGLRAEQRTQVAEVRNEIAELRAEQRTQVAEVRTEIAELRAEQRTQVAEVRTEIAELRAEQRTQIAEVRTEIANLDTRLSTRRRPQRSPASAPRLRALRPGSSAGWSGR